MKTAIIFVVLLVIGFAGCERKQARGVPNKILNQGQTQEPEPTEAERIELEKNVTDFLTKSSEDYVDIGWQEVPSWASDLPFDLKSLIDIPAEENRESAWLNAFLEFSLPDFGKFFPYLRRNQERFWPYSKLQSAYRNKAIDFYLDQVNHDGKPGRRLLLVEIEKAQDLLIPFQAGLRKLEMALERPRCFFHSDWETNALSSSAFAAADVQFLMALHFQTKMPDTDSLRLIEIGMQLHRDLARLPQLGDQITLNRLEKSIFHNMVHLILEHEDMSAKTLDRLISILKQHQSEVWKTDPFVELTRRELLNFRHLFHQLTHQTYVTPKRAEDLFLDPDAKLLDLLLRQVVDIGLYGIHTEQVKTEIKRISNNSPQVKKAWKKIETDKTLEQEGARMILQLFIPLGLETLAPSDLDEDIEVLNTRHQQVLDAVRLPYPDSSYQLLKLEKNWTLDESWHNTKILRWFTPHNRGTRLRQVFHNRYGAYLCLAALRKWQLDHPDGSPADLKQALSKIGLEQIPVDAFSGKPLLFLESEKEYVIYSIGPDEIDDKAQKEFDPYNEKDNRGDVVFRMIRNPDGSNERTPAEAQSR